MSSRFHQTASNRSESNLIVPFLDEELPLISDPDVEEGIEAFIASRQLHAPGRAEDTAKRDLLLRRPLRVPPLTILDVGLEAIADDAEPGALRRLGVNRALGLRGLVLSTTNRNPVSKQSSRIRRSRCRVLSMSRLMLMCVV